MRSPRVRADELRFGSRPHARHPEDDLGLLVLTEAGSDPGAAFGCSAVAGATRVRALGESVAERLLAGATSRRRPGSAHFSPTTGLDCVSRSPFRAPEACPEAGRAAPEGTEGSGHQPGRGASWPCGQGRVAPPTRTGRPWYVTAERGSLEVWRHGHGQWSTGSPGTSVPVRPPPPCERSTTAAERTHHGSTCRTNARSPWRDGLQRRASRGACQAWRGAGVGHRFRLSSPLLVKED